MAQKRDTHTPVKCIRNRPEYKDGLYGSGITWKKGEVIEVPNEIAEKLLNHPDVWIKADGRSKIASVAELPVKEEEATEDEVQLAKDSLKLMDAESLRAYAQTNFAGIKISKSITKPETLRAKVENLIDQFGITK